MRWVFVATGLVAAGCTRPNAAFDEGGRSTEAGTADDDGGTTRTAAGDDAATTEPDPDTQSTTRADDGRTDDAGATDGDTGTTGIDPTDGGNETGGEPACPGHPDAGIELTVHTGLGDAIEPDCAAPSLDALGMIAVNDGAIEVTQCDDCSAGCNGEIVVFDLHGSVDVPDGLTGCGHMYAWADTAGVGDCAWVGIAEFSATATPIPNWLAANRRQIPDLMPNSGYAPELSPVEGCEVRDCPTAGTYALAFGDTIVAVGDPPTVATLDFVAGVPFVVDNRQSFVDEACVEHVSWTAVVQ